MNIEALEELLRQLDALSDEIRDEDFDDLNAEFEDALFMLSEMEGEDEESAEEFEALREGYERWPQARPLAARLGMLLENGTAE